MNTILIVASGAIVGCIVTSYFVWKLYGKVALLSRNTSGQFSEMNLNSKLSTMFSEGASNNTVDDLTKMVFDNIKKTYHLESKSYSTVISEIRMHDNINGDLKEVLISFFEEIIRISYRAEVISESEKEDLKNKVKLILEILN